MDKQVKQTESLEDQVCLYSIHKIAAVITNNGESNFGSPMTKVFK